MHAFGPGDEPEKGDKFQSDRPFEFEALSPSGAEFQGPYLEPIDLYHAQFRAHCHEMGLVEYLSPREGKSKVPELSRVVNKFGGVREFKPHFLVVHEGAGDVTGDRRAFLSSVTPVGFNEYAAPTMRLYRASLDPLDTVKVTPPLLMPPFERFKSPAGVIDLRHLGSDAKSHHISVMMSEGAFYEGLCTVKKISDVLHRDPHHPAPLNVIEDGSLLLSLMVQEAESAAGCTATISLDTLSSPESSLVFTLRLTLLDMEAAISGEAISLRGFRKEEQWIKLARSVYGEVTAYSIHRRELAA